MNRCLDCTQIWYGCSLGISDDLNNFWVNPFEKNDRLSHLKKNDMGVIFFSLFLDIDGQSLRLRGPAIN